MEVLEDSLAAVAAFAYGDEVIVTRSGVRWFVGKVGKLPKYANRSAVGSSYEVWGPWWDLTRCTYPTGASGEELGALIIAPGGALDRWLFVEMSPAVETVTLLDADSVEFVEYRPLGTVIIEEAQIATSDSDFGVARPPLIDYETGDIEETGRFYFYLGNCTFDTGAKSPSPSNLRKGNFTFLFTPPNRLFLMPESEA